MRFYWSRKSIPELAKLDKEEYAKLLALTCWKPFFHWQFWLVLIFWLFVGFCLFLLFEGGITSFPRFIVAATVVILFDQSVMILRMNFQLSDMISEINRHSKECL